ncbi:15-hydroxyprostaglandin dehydrogenase [NAD(+)] [Polyodon spathula]|uniref:15-hydroxyprostaglandin dehydrogenase [NAD(+)] n=1 Tax=Polyodon spathula TaxID=7913 RepID=UPI001B7F3BCA|nr:15-hydroxyprostaglandin dehydrogenase [NAD(+)] [Polyodon spathula]
MALSGKVAIVTGGSQGLGKAFTEILLKHGANVSLLDINVPTGNKLKAALDKEYGSDRTCFISCDVTSETQLQEAFNKTLEVFGRLDIVCNNAGIGNENNWERTVDINLNGVIRGSYLALQHMKKQNKGQGGVIVNIGSMAGLGPFLSAPVYTATKHAVVGFSRALADASQVSDYGVRINVLCPSFAKTDILETFNTEDLMGQFSNLRPTTQKLLEQMGVLDPSQVAEQFLQLVTDDSRNGAVLSVTQAGASYMEYPKSIM